MSFNPRDRRYKPPSGRCIALLPASLRVGEAGDHERTRQGAAGPTGGPRHRFRHRADEAVLPGLQTDEQLTRRFHSVLSTITVTLGPHYWVSEHKLLPDVGVLECDYLIPSILFDLVFQHDSQCVFDNNLSGLAKTILGISPTAN